MGIEPTLVAWEATVLPLNYTRLGRHSIGRARNTATGPACRTGGTPRRTRQALPDGVYGRIRAFGRTTTRQSIAENEQ